MLVDARLATNDDIPAIGATLGRAFLGDPFVSHMLGPASSQVDHVVRFMSLVLEHGYLPKGHVWHAGDGSQAAALWGPPGQWQLSDDAAGSIAGPMMEIGGPQQLEVALRSLAAVEEKHPEEPHWYLAVLGTDPDWQGKGFGSAAMAPVLAKADEEGVPAYLESSKERNVPLYERHGFRVTEEITLPDDGPPIWLMWREPRS